MNQSKKHLISLGIYTVLFTGLMFTYNNCSRKSSFTADPSFSESETISDAQSKNCEFNGRSVADGATVQAYLVSAVDFGHTCTPQARTCSNGQLSGNHQFATCAVGVAASCLFNGQTIAHGASVTSFLNSSVPFGSSCQQETRTCNNGALSGSSSYATCAVGTAKSCLFNGQTIAHGRSVKAYYSSSVPYGSTCNGVDRTCNDGVLSGTNTYGSCVVGAAASCIFNGQTIAHGQSVTAYEASSVAYGQTCQSQARTCTNGTLSGSNIYGTCAVGAGAACLLNGQTIAHGSSINTYEKPTVPYGSACNLQARTCSNGALSGSYTNSTCLVESPLGLLTNPSCRLKKNPVILTKDTTIKVTTQGEYIAQGDSNYLIKGDNLTINIDSLYRSCIEIVGNNNTLVSSDANNPSIDNYLKVLGSGNTITAAFNSTWADIQGDRTTLNLKSNYNYSNDTNDITIGARIKIVGDEAIVNHLNKKNQDSTIKIKGDRFLVKNNNNALSGNYYVIEGNSGEFFMTDNGTSVNSNLGTGDSRMTALFRVHYHIKGNNNYVMIPTPWSNFLNIYGSNNNVSFNGVDFSNRSDILISNSYNYAPTTQAAPPYVGID